jgi:hypothetical protein
MKITKLLLTLVIIGVLAGSVIAEGDVEIAITAPTPAENNTWRNYSTVTFVMEYLDAANTSVGNCKVTVNGANESHAGASNTSVNTNESTSLTFSVSDSATHFDLGVACNGSTNDSELFMKYDGTAPVVKWIDPNLDRNRIHDRASTVEVNIADAVANDFRYYSTDANVTKTNGSTDINNVDATHSIDISAWTKGNTYTLNVCGNDSAENVQCRTREFSVIEADGSAGLVQIALEQARQTGDLPTVGKQSTGDKIKLWLKNGNVIPNTSIRVPGLVTLIVIVGAYVLWIKPKGKKKR